MSSSPLPSRNQRSNPRLDLSLMQMRSSTPAIRARLSADLQTHFTSVFSDPDDPKVRMPTFSPQFSQPLTDFTFSPADIQSAIEGIDENSSCGENDMPAKVLRKCRSNLSYPIYLLWTRPSLSTKERSCLPTSKTRSYLPFTRRVVKLTLPKFCTI